MSQAKAATTFPIAQAVPEPPRDDELRIVGDIAHATLRAARPVEVYRLALDRVTPRLGASFSSVFLRDPADPTVVKLECAHNWPQAAAWWLGELRFREGRGPTGRAVADGVPIEVTDVFADPRLRDWWDPARELGFASLVSLPLTVDDHTAGALTFYFAQPRTFDDAERRLLTLVADQLAVTASRARLLEELRHTNEQLRQRNVQLVRRVEEGEELRRMKDEFLANVSHELRTPLTSIIGYAQLLADGELGELDPKHARALRRIEVAGNALLRLITDLLDLTQLKLGRTRAVPAAHDAAGLARVAVSLVGPPPEGVRFDLRPPAAQVQVHTDGEKAVRVLTNLLKNAFKFTTAGEVVLTIRGAGDGVEWEVRDTGIGIEERDQEAVFDEFRQVDGSTTRLFGGTGLGLALSRQLAALLDGSVELQSAPGTGSTFTFRLPVKGSASSEPVPLT